MKPVLALNGTYAPLSLITWERAISLIVQERAEVVENPAFSVRSPSTTMTVPSIIKLKSKAFPKSRKVRLSRKNVLLRDDFTCHYCGQKKAKNLLNMDHVVPRAKGGQTRWTNIVTACIECNSRKGDKTLAEAGLKLLRDPQPPNWSMAHKITFHLKDVPKEWVPYLGAAAKSKG